MGKLKFDIIESQHREEFKEAVQKRLDEGWELHGSMQAVPYQTEGSADSISYIQAVVKDVREESFVGFRRQS